MTGSSPCENNNGFCVNATCVPNGDTKSTCKCPGRYPGAVNDGRMCRVDNRQCQSGQFTCIYGKKPCISKRYTCDTDCDCEDCSDEDPTYCGTFFYFVLLSLQFSPNSLQFMNFILAFLSQSLGEIILIMLHCQIPDLSSDF